MTRAIKAPIVVIVSIFGMLAASGPVRAGFISVVLSAGESGSTTATSSTFQFTSPSSSSSLVAVNQLTGAGSVTATTGGGVSFFTASGLPMVLNVADGSAYLSSSTAPSGAVPTSGLSSVAPQPTAIPAGSALLNVTATQTTNGGELLSVNVTNQAGSVLGSGQINVSGTGWWVLGLTPNSSSSGSGTSSSGSGTSSSGSGTSSPPPTATTPEPTALALAVIGLPLAGFARLVRRKTALLPANG